MVLSLTYVSDFSNPSLAAPFVSKAAGDRDRDSPSLAIPPNTVTVMTDE